MYTLNFRIVKIDFFIVIIQYIDRSLMIELMLNDI